MYHSQTRKNVIESIKNINFSEYSLINLDIWLLKFNLLSITTPKSSTLSFNIENQQLSVLLSASFILDIHLWSIDTCQNKVSTDKYHVTISQAKV